MKTTANIAGIKPVISGTLHLQGQSDITLSNSDFVQNSLAFKSGTSNSSEFSVGAAIIGECDFSLMNDSGKFSGLDWFDSRVEITLTADGTALDMGYFYVVKHHELGNVVTVESYNALKILDEHALYELTQDYGLTFPCTVSAILTALQSQHGFTITGCRGSNITVQDPQSDMMTQRALISYIAQLSGQYVKAVGQNLQFTWYNTGTVYNAGNTFSHDLRTSDISITGCKVSTEDGTASETRGTAGYMLNISDNPLITSGNVSAVADLIYAAVGGITYRPGSVSIVANPAIEAGDLLSVNTGQESGITIIATTLIYKPQLQQSVTADAEPYAGDLRISRSAYIKRQAQQTINDELSNPDSNLSKAIDAGGGGGGGSGNGVKVYNLTFGSSTNKLIGKATELYIDTAGNQSTTTANANLNLISVFGMSPVVVPDEEVETGSKTFVAYIPLQIVCDMEGASISAPRLHLIRRARVEITRTGTTDTLSSVSIPTLYSGEKFVEWKASTSMARYMYVITPGSGSSYAKWADWLVLTEATWS